MTNTAHYGLKEVGPGESISDEGYKFGTTDRETIDAELYKAATHHHTGSATTVTSPASAPTLSLASTVGNFLPSTRYYYRYTWINAQGIESQSSPENFIDTAPATDSPDAPTLSTAPVGGALLSGQYYYVLTAYNPDSSHETLAASAAVVTTAVGTTNTITVTFPTLPSGAHGYNIYRRSPGGVGYLFMTAIPMNVATPPSSWTDDGSVLANCDRTLPSFNSTNTTQSIQVCIGGASPAIPAGSIWRIYRTGAAGNYANSLLTTISTPDLCFIDTGLGTSPGTYPTQNSLSAPDKVLLTDGAEVQGRLPMGDATYPFEITFEWPGSVTPNSSIAIWVCEFPKATIIGARLATSKSNTTTGAYAQLYKGSDATPSYDAMFTGATPTYPTLNSGVQIGDRVVPSIKSLVVGDSLFADILNIYGATPSASNLTLYVYGIAHGYPTTPSFVDGTTTGT